MKSNVTQIMNEYSKFALPKLDVQMSTVTDLGVDMMSRRTKKIAPSDFGTLVEGLYSSQYTSWSESFLRTDVATSYDQQRTYPNNKAILSMVAAVNERRSRDHIGLKTDDIDNVSEEDANEIVASSLEFVDIANQLVSEPHTFSLRTRRGDAMRIAGSIFYLVHELGIRGDHDFMSDDAVVDMKVRKDRTSLNQFSQLFMYAYMLRLCGYDVSRCQIMNVVYGTLHEVPYTEEIHHLTERFLEQHGLSKDLHDFRRRLSGDFACETLFPKCLFALRDLEIDGLRAKNNEMYSSSYESQDDFLYDIDMVFTAIDVEAINQNRLDSGGAQYIKRESARAIMTRCAALIDDDALKLIADWAFNGDVARATALFSSIK